MDFCSNTLYNDFIVMRYEEAGSMDYITKSEFMEAMEHLTNRMDAGFNRIHQVMAVSEQKNDEQHKALFDGLVTNTESINRLETRVDSLEGRFDGLESQVKKNTTSIENLSVDVKALTVKVEKHEVHLKVVK